MHGMRRGLELAADWMFPRECLACGDPPRRRHDFCLPCWNDLPRIDSACPRCGLPSPTNAECGRCQRRPPAFDRTIALFRYEHPVDFWIQQLKYGHKLHIARSLGEAFADHILESGADLPDRLIPVPLHRSRMRERGFNQSLEIARTIARILQVPVDHRSILRSRPTAPQSDLPYDKRRSNVRGTFSVDRSIPSAYVAVVDDVMTTGSTVNEVARCLRQSKVKDLAIWSLARAI